MIFFHGTTERTIAALEAGYVSNRHHVAHWRTVLLAGTGLGHTDQPHHGAGGLCNGILVDACDCGAAVEVFSPDAGNHMVRGGRLLLAVFALARPSCAGNDARSQCLCIAIALLDVQAGLILSQYRQTKC